MNRLNRIEQPRGDEGAELTEEQRVLYDRAFDSYSTRCLWNCKPSMSHAGLLTIIERLRLYGDMEAWSLANQIEESILHASRRISKTDSTSLEQSSFTR